MDHRVSTVIEYMTANLQRRLPLREIALVARLAPARLRQLFKAETGQPPLQYLSELRMRRAKALLETTVLNVKEIAASVGGSDVSHFVRKFEERFGVGPVAHRSRHHRARPGEAEADQRNG